MAAFIVQPSLIFSALHQSRPISSHHYRLYPLSLLKVTPRIERRRLKYFERRAMPQRQHRPCGAKLRRAALGSRSPPACANERKDDKYFWRPYNFAHGTFTEAGKSRTSAAMFRAACFGIIRPQHSGVSPSSARIDAISMMHYVIFDSLMVMIVVATIVALL